MQLPERMGLVVAPGKQWLLAWHPFDHHRRLSLPCPQYEEGLSPLRLFSSELVKLVGSLLTVFVQGACAL